MEKYDNHGFLIDGCEDKGHKCLGCYEERLNDRPNLKSKVSRGEYWVKLLCPDEIVENSFDYKLNVDKLNHQLQSLEWNYKKDLSELVSCVDLEVAKYEDRSMPEDFKTMRQILMDVDRTFPNHKLFISDSSKRFCLFRVLVIYAQYNRLTGYCQGMAYVAALLLMYIDSEEDVFWCFVYLLNNQLSCFYEKDLKRVKVLAEVLSTALSEQHPKMSDLLDRLQIHPLLYTTQWFMSLFTGLNCWDTALYIAELVFKEGLHQLLNSALAILGECEAKILEMSSLEEVLPFLQNIPSSLVHRHLIESRLKNTRRFQSVIDMQQYIVVAEKKVYEEDATEERIRCNNNRKRRRELEQDNKNESGGSVLVKPPSSVTVPNSKRPKFPFTPQTSKLSQSVIKTSTLKKSAIHSLKKGHAELCFTKDAGLVYTSPNTMEMKDICIADVRPAKLQPIISNEKENTHIVAMKLSFDTDNDTPCS